MNNGNPAILLPAWPRPSFAKPGKSLSVSFRKPVGPVMSASLANGRREIKLGPLRPAGRRLWCRIPPEASEGFFGLRILLADGKTLFSPSSVKILPEFKNAFTFLHISDFHINRFSAGKLKKLVGIINRLNPEFVLNTGDIIDRYRLNPHDLLDSSCVRRQIKNACESLLKLRVPAFFSPGNHDFAFPWYRGMWNEYGHNAFSGAKGDYSFDYGKFRFICLDASIEYDGPTRMAESPGFSSRRLRWLARKAESAGEDIKTILFFHYDYSGDAAGFLKDIRLDAVFYGHSREKPLWSRGARFIDGHIRHGMAYQKITAGNSGLRIQPGPMIDEI